jgi:hypothetical protein
MLKRLLLCRPAEAGVGFDAGGEHVVQDLKRGFWTLLISRFQIVPLVYIVQAYVFLVVFPSY